MKRFGALLAVCFLSGCYDETLGGPVTCRGTPSCEGVTLRGDATACEQIPGCALAQCLGDPAPCAAHADFADCLNARGCDLDDDTFACVGDPPPCKDREARSFECNGGCTLTSEDVCSGTPQRRCEDDDFSTECIALGCDFD